MTTESCIPIPVHIWRMLKAVVIVDVRRKGCPDFFHLASFCITHYASPISSLENPAGGLFQQSLLESD